MNRVIRATAVAALCTSLAGAALVAGTVSAPAADRSGAARTQTGKIRIDGYSVNVSCSGDARAKGPLVLLMAGGGDGLDTMAGLQKTLSEKSRVCSYDRLGEGASDQPAGLQTVNDSGRILTGVLDRLAGHRPVVLAGHSLGGYLAARYAPAHRDRIKGLVLLDATIPALTAGLNKAIPQSATGLAAELRDQTLAANQGQNPEQLVIADTEVRSAGRIPVRILKHESQYAEVPEYGPALEEMWTAGQRQWRALSPRATLRTAPGTGHYIHVDRPDLAVGAIRNVTAQASR
ncbi:alpha/beta fold hydrolase [Streptomyces sp. NPDC023723]|uniref:alpha/beta fold hydrolase n=1 Tax=Streptomyces sp. NPDC023723 TaxID=3154323 RepID=UPI003406A7AB